MRAARVLWLVYAVGRRLRKWEAANKLADDERLVRAKVEGSYELRPEGGADVDPAGLSSSQGGDERPLCLTRKDVFELLDGEPALPEEGVPATLWAAWAPLRPGARLPRAAGRHIASSYAYNSRCECELSLRDNCRLDK